MATDVISIEPTAAPNGGSVSYLPYHPGDSQ
jgi:hypothetical protein